MIDIVLLIVISCLFVATGFLMWRVKRLETENEDCQRALASVSNLIFQLSKTCVAQQKAITDSSKAVVMVAEAETEIRKDFLLFKKDVTDFIAVATQQISFLAAARQKERSSGNFGPPAKKNDKIKPN